MLNLWACRLRLRYILERGDFQGLQDCGLGDGVGCCIFLSIFMGWRWGWMRVGNCNVRRAIVKFIGFCTVGIGGLALVWRSVAENC